ncbi:FAD-binding oxidoreductase [Opitutia bacterium ISCC 51]|nr:FAD-binding oxidoreductase [Opitutae bacterium ISCC 51]QXD28367.1 FAD-binding oxidoreductase [Opitutae bacterium ISCC 52]
MNRFQSWGRFPKAEQDIYAMRWKDGMLPDTGEKSVLPFGLGRSYGDSCLNNGQSLVETSGLNRFIAFDEKAGTLCCEAGVSLDEILKLIVPKGWFLPTTPGTKFITVGGAIANDIHGKNHHVAGTFGCHVKAFELLRSDGSRTRCTPRTNSELFKATIGGLGLTGLITWAEFRLKKINNAWIEMESIKFEGIGEFMKLSRESDQDWEYTVSWIDCVARGKAFARGIFMRGNHAPAIVMSRKVHAEPKLTTPFNCPNMMLNSLSIKAFNTVYYGKQRAKKVRSRTHYDPFFYPLDAVNDWNRIYGRRGFFQYQFVVPFEGGSETMEKILEKITVSKQGSFLAVIKAFGDKKSPGMLSFPKPGITLALDFPNRGESTTQLFNDLDQIVDSAGGSVYPAKDARMSPDFFQKAYPQWEAFSKFIDPQFSSSFWRRVTVQA